MKLAQFWEGDCSRTRKKDRKEREVMEMRKVMSAHCSQDQHYVSVEHTVVQSENLFSTDGTSLKNKTNKQKAM